MLFKALVCLDPGSGQSEGKKIASTTWFDLYFNKQDVMIKKIQHQD